MYFFPKTKALLFVSIRIIIATQTKLAFIVTEIKISLLPTAQNLQYFKMVIP